MVISSLGPDWGIPCWWNTQKNLKTQVTQVWDVFFDWLQLHHSWYHSAVTTNIGSTVKGPDWLCAIWVDFFASRTYRPIEHEAVCGFSAWLSPRPFSLSYRCVSLVSLYRPAPVASFPHNDEPASIIIFWVFICIHERQSLLAGAEDTPFSPGAQVQYVVQSIPPLPGFLVSNSVGLLACLIAF